MAAPLSQSLSTFVIPSSERTDPESVLRSLAQARIDFERGEVREALKHLRHAAAEADDAGNDLRGVALARAAADLATEVGSSLTPPPVAVAPAAVSLRAPAVPPPAPPPLAAPPRATTSVAPAASSSAPAATASPVAPAATASPVAPAATASPAASPIAPAASPIAPAAASALAPAAVPSVAPSKAPTSAVRGNADAALQQLLDSGRAVKVVVKRSARDEGLYVVRRADSEAVALGTREAVIVLLEADDGFFTTDDARRDLGA